jgi:hypothetical protein
VGSPKTDSNQERVRGLKGARASTPQGY